MPGKSHRWGIFALAALLCLLLADAAPAKTFEPTRKDDPTPGKCKPNDCSLREAISAANARAGADRVVLGEGRYRIELPDDGNDDNGDGDFDLIDQVSIVGKGPKRTTVDGNQMDTVFQLLTFPPHALKGLTIRGGSAAPGIGGGVFISGSKATIDKVAIKNNDAPEGGGITSFSNDLTISRSRIAGNDATGRGGGILFRAGIFPESATIRSSTITGNDAGAGGGINADGTNDGSLDEEPHLNVVNSTIAGNTATDTGGGIKSTASELTTRRTTISGNTASEGGGVDLRPAAELPVTRILSSTISDNTATNKAGGILADGNPYSGSDFPEEPELHVFNSTIADNKANNDAGGIMGDNGASLDLDHVSIGFNRANDDNTGIAVAGGVYQHSNANFSVDDSVIAHNEVGQGGGDPDCSATQVFSGTGNAISSSDGCDVSFTTPFNVYSAAPIANQLADNGGPTQTMRVPAGSVAIGFANACPKRDQRGRLRPANCDSGAFENRPK